MLDAEVKAPHLAISKMPWLSYSPSPSPSLSPAVGADAVGQTRRNRRGNGRQPLEIGKNLAKIVEGKLAQVLVPS